MANKTGKGTFKKGDDPRRNNAGQRDKKAVETAAEYRSLIVQILHEPHGTPLPAEMTNLEVIARVHVANSKKESDEREKLLDRIWGKANQPIDLTSSDGSMTPGAVTFVPYEKPNVS
jgi:hypothetical protein